MTTIKTHNRSEALIAIGMITAMTGSSVYSSDIKLLPDKTWYRENRMLRLEIDISHTPLTESQADVILTQIGVVEKRVALPTKGTTR